MNASENGTVTYYGQSQLQQQYELVYIASTFLFTFVVALIASFFGLHRRRHGLTSTPSFHGTRSGSDGKTQFVFKLVQNVDVMVDPTPSRIVYCYGEYQQLFRKYPLVTFHQGLPNIADFDGSEPVLLVIDDLMNEADESVANLFTKGSHHRNVSVIFLVQNLFHKNKHVRTISLNSHYMVLFKNPRDASQFASLARPQVRVRYRSI